MTGDEMQTLGMRAWGRGHQARIAAGLGVDVRTVRRWMTGEVAIPKDRAAAVVALAGRKVRAGAFAKAGLDRLLAEAAEAGLARPEVLAALLERALLLSAVSTIATRKTAADAKR